MFIEDIILLQLLSACRQGVLVYIGIIKKYAFMSIMFEIKAYRDIYIKYN